MNLSVNSSPDFPLDIFSCIVDIFASEDDIESLKACSLTCSTFHSLCTKHIFATIKINPDLVSHRPGAFRQFRGVLDRTPAVATYVKRLDLEIEESDPNIPYILVKLLNVKAFSLSFYFETSWHAIPTALTTSLERFIQSSDLTLLRLENIHDLPIASIFSCSTHLQDLDLRWEVGLSANNANLASMQRKHYAIPHLQSLSMGPLCCETARRLLGQGLQNLPILDFSVLSTLTLALVQTDEQFEFAKCLLKIAKQLKVLKLYVNNHSYEPLEPLRFMEHMHPSSQKTLQNLKLSYIIQSEIEDPYCGACEELILLASAKCPLQSIELEVALSTDRACSTQKVAWRKLNDVATLANFPLLRQVTIGVHLCVYGLVGRDLMDRLGDVAREDFETLRSQPSIDFEFLTTNHADKSVSKHIFL